MKVEVFNVSTTQSLIYPPIWIDGGRSMEWFVEAG